MGNRYYKEKKRFCKECKHYYLLPPGFEYFEDENENVKCIDTATIPYDGFCLRKRHLKKFKLFAPKNQWNQYRFELGGHQLVNKSDKRCKSFTLKEEII